MKRSKFLYKINFKIKYLILCYIYFFNIHYTSYKSIIINNTFIYGGKNSEIKNLISFPQITVITIKHLCF